MTNRSPLSRLLRPYISAVRSRFGTNEISDELHRLLSAIEAAEAQRGINTADVQAHLRDLESRILSRIANLELLMENAKAQQRTDAPSADTSHVPGARDLLCKWLEFSPGIGAYLVLPVSSTDPVVSAYRSGHMINSYMLEVLLETTEAGDQVIDLGCHVGTFSIGAAALGRKVLAVDASPLHISLMQHSKDINNLADLRPCHAAMAAQEGLVRFVENGLFGAVAFSSTSPNAIEVPARHLDSIVEAHDIGPVRFLKMDVEGAEVDAILTGGHMLRRDHPVIWFESNGPVLQLAGHTVDELRGCLERCGYRVFRIEGDRWIHAPVGQIQPEAWVDMLALSERDQQRWATRIDWNWPPEAVLEKCRAWADLPHGNTQSHLLHEIRTHSFDAGIRDGIAEIELKLQSQLAEPDAAPH